MNITDEFELTSFIVRRMNDLNDFEIGKTYKFGESCYIVKSFGNIYDVMLTDGKKLIFTHNEMIIVFTKMFKSKFSDYKPYEIEYNWDNIKYCFE